jgi:hypothetical protein
LNESTLFVIVQATATHDLLGPGKGKDYYFPLFLNMDIIKSDKEYLRLTPFEALLPDCVPSYKQMKGHKFPIAIESGINDCKIMVFPYIDFGIVNILDHGTNKLSFNWTGSDKKHTYYRFCKLNFNKK